MTKFPDIGLITSTTVTVESAEPNTVVVIDDKSEQIAAAEKAVTDAGFKVRSVRAGPDTKSKLWKTIALPGVVGILTDLMFPLSDSSGVQPNGLLVAVHGVSLGIPVVICTDADGDHHAGGCGAVRDGYYNGWVSEPAFGFDESKNWAYAMKELISRMKTTPQG